jgi:hypothetical protein
MQASHEIAAMHAHKFGALLLLA